jgi:cell wall assembly regulator SMI1
MSAPVAESWDRIVGWLTENLPATANFVNPPAPDKTIFWLETAIGYSLPADLADYLRLADGTRHRWVRGSLIPTLYNLLPAEGMLSERKKWRQVYGEKRRPEDDQPAGTRSDEWLDAFLPIADAAVGVSLFVDLRPGDRYGCVCEFDPESGGHVSAPWWTGVADMFEDVAEAMVNGRPALQEYSNGARWRLRPVLPGFEEDDDYLRWDSVYAD